MPLTQDRKTASRDGFSLGVPVAAGAIIFAGSQVVFDANGYLAPGTTATGLTYAGRADEYVDNSGGADGDLTCLISRKKAFFFANSGTDPVTQASVGKPCYIEDDQTVAATDGTGTRSASGIVVAVESNGVWVE